MRLNSTRSGEEGKLKAHLIAIVGTNKIYSHRIPSLSALDDDDLNDFNHFEEASPFALDPNEQVIGFRRDINLRNMVIVTRTSENGDEPEP